MESLNQTKKFILFFEKNKTKYKIEKEKNQWVNQKKTVIRVFSLFYFKKNWQ